MPLRRRTLGTIGTRTIAKQLGEFPSSAEAWERRIQSGQAMTQMTTVIGRLDVPLAIKLFGDWTDRIAGGELPFAQPPRPQGIERNVVLTLWDWGRPTGYLHDEVSTDRRTPTVKGLLLFAIAFEMVLGVRIRRKGQAAEEAVEEHVRNIAAFPLAIPLMAGPGAITATVLLHRPSNDLRPTSIIFEETEVSDGP